VVVYSGDHLHADPQTYRKYKATFHASAPHRPPGAGVPLRAPPPPAGAACSPAARGGARSGQAPLRGGAACKADHAPHLVLTRHVAHEHGERLMDIKPIGLGATLTTIGLNTGRVDHEILHAMRHQAAVQPETLTSCLIAAHHAALLAQAKALFGLRNL